MSLGGGHEISDLELSVDLDLILDADVEDGNFDEPALIGVG